MRTMTRFGVLVLVAIGLQVPAAHGAFSMKAFQTPSGTTLCAFLTVDGKTSLRCDVMKATNDPPAKPKSCDGDYGFSFSLNPSGAAKRICVSDAIADPRKTKKLAYGTSITRSSMTCRSTRAALICKNRSGHGFRLNRSAQTLF